MFELDSMININNRKVYMSCAPKDIEEAKEFGKKMLEHSIRTVIVLLSNEEVRDIYGSPNALYSAYKSSGMKVEHFPLRDFGVPESNTEMNIILMKLLSILKSGQDILIHCHAGRGRTGLIVIGLLVSLGMTAKDAYQKVNKVRKVVDTEKQMNFLVEYEKSVRSSGKRKR